MSLSASFDMVCFFRRQPDGACLFAAAVGRRGQLEEDEECVCVYCLPLSADASLYNCIQYIDTHTNTHTHLCRRAFGRRWAHYHPTVQAINCSRRLVPRKWRARAASKKRKAARGATWMTRPPPSIHWLMVICFPKKSIPLSRTNMLVCLEGGVCLWFVRVS
jgi:hypothetical protein